ncbi:MAG: long-chain fatty acid--CoA ligase [Chromatiales bacterium]|nr:long-chain fatty acid--CoA ligase [Chromatiales bacterium]
MPERSPDLISLDEAGTLDSLFMRRVERSADRVAYLTHDRATDTWIESTWGEVGHAVACWQAALRAEGLKPGDRVAVLLRNCKEWVIFDQAALGLGLVVVPLYTEDRPENADFVLTDSGTQLLLIQDTGRWRRLRAALGENSPLRRVWILEPGRDGAEEAAADERVRLVPDCVRHTGAAAARRAGDPHELASIVYTSGTTGRPKGVMLSHHNMLSVAYSALTMIDIYAEDRMLSFLPLSHTLERTGGYYLPMLAGCSVAYSRSVAQLAADIEAVRPTILISVPRIFERVYARLNDQLRSQSTVARWLFGSAVAVGWRRFLRSQGRARWHPNQLAWPVLRSLIATRLHQRLGGALRLAVSGGAALPPAVARTFLGLDVTILQGYGLTETSPVISVNLPADNDPHSVGVPLRGVEVRIGADDELLVKTPGCMLGYWNNDAATRAMIDADGWLHTGDQARVDDGHIYITGRLKDILVLSNGEKLPPGDMELAIVLDDLIEQVMVVGEGRAYLAALVVLSAEHWPAFARTLDLDPAAPASLAAPAAHNAVLARIRAALKGFPGYAKIRRVHLALAPWTVDNGLLTPTLKVRRAEVARRFAAEIEALYAGGPAD